jgi:hypothetical protein
VFIRQIIISDESKEKIWAKHQVEDSEINEIFDDRPYIEFREKGKNVKGENVYAAWGRTSAGRYLIDSSFTRWPRML